MRNKVVFCDRDGVLNIDTGYPKDFHIDMIKMETAYGLRKIQERGYNFIIVSNQSGIARGLLTEADVRQFNDHLIDVYQMLGVSFLDVVFCPHHPDATIKEYRGDCRCRKPKPGMITDMVTKHNLIASECLLIGDKDSDVAAGARAGCGISLLLDENKPMSRNANRIQSVLDVLEFIQ